MGRHVALGVLVPWIVGGKVYVPLDLGRNADEAVPDVFVHLPKGLNSVRLFPEIIAKFASEEVAPHDLEVRNSSTVDRDDRESNTKFLRVNVALTDTRANCSSSILETVKEDYDGCGILLGDPRRVCLLERSTQ